MKNLFALFTITLAFSALTATNLNAGSCGGCGGKDHEKDKTEEKGQS